MNTKKDYAAVLFDFDGTLFDSWSAIQKAYEITYRHFYPQGSIVHIQTIKSAHQDYVATLKMVFPDEARHAEIKTFLEKVYHDVVVEHTPLFANVPKTLRVLNDNNTRWGIVTNKRKIFANRLIAAAGREFDMLACLVCHDDVTHPKPDPEPILKACALLKITPNDALYVGDLPADKAAAKACHMDFALAAYGYTPENEKLKKDDMQYYLSDIQDLLQVLGFAERQ